jgi:hypothetical protein
MSDKMFVFWMGLIFSVIFIGGIAFGVQAINTAQAEKLRQQTVMANYRSPKDRTDAERLDWLTAHPTKTPWTKYGTDPRHEIDYTMDREEEVAK